jgi:putative CocE/NonD family hydrolase
LALVKGPRSEFHRVVALVLDMARTLALAALLTFALAPAAHGQTETIRGYIPMSDGITLAYQVVLPDKAKHGPGPYPTVMDYSGYGPGRTVNYELDTRFVERGYALAGVNIRGTGCSGGKFDYFEPRQSIDGKEAIEWLTKQPWSNGRLGMVSKSYPGITQLFVAAQRPKGLVAITPGHVFGDLYRDVPYPGGIMNETFAGGWSLATQPAPSIQQGLTGTASGDQTCAANQAQHAENPRYNPFVQAFEHLYDDDLFRERSPYEFVDKIEVPTLLVEAWQDEQVGSRAANLTERFAKKTDWHLLASNGDHNEYYGPASLPLIQSFLDHHVRGVRNEWDKEERVIVQWEKDSERKPAFTTRHAAFPPPGADVLRLYLHDDATLSEAKPAGGGSTSYAYAPALGTHNQIWSSSPPDAARAVFTSAPFARDVAWLGSGSVDLELQSTAPDTDLEVMVTEVRPDGQEVYVQRGWLRASHRKLDPARSTETRPYQTHREADMELLTPGETAPVRVELFPTGHVFRKGSALRLWVEAPAAFSGLWGFVALPLPAQNTILDGSSIALPVLRGFKAPTGYPSCDGLRNQPCREDPVPATTRAP